MMNQMLDILSKYRKNIKVINLEGAIDINLSGDSSQPDLVVLNGKLKESDFDEAVSLIPNGGIVVMTRANSKGVQDIKRGKELYGDAYKVIAGKSKEGYLFYTVRNAVCYIKGNNGEPLSTTVSDWVLSKRKDIAPILLPHNLKVILKGVILEEPTKPKRKRRTKAEIEADNEDTKD